MLFSSLIDFPHLALLLRKEQDYGKISTYDSIRRVIAVNWDGKAMPLCGTCREFMVQLMPDDYNTIEIMLDNENEKFVTLGELTPEWWL